MQPTLDALRAQLRIVLDDKTAQGHQTGSLNDDLNALPNSYDGLAQFAERLADLPLREDWPYVEPNDLDAIWAECHPDRPTGLEGNDTDSFGATAGSILGAFFGPEGLEERWLAGWLAVPGLLGLAQFIIVAFGPPKVAALNYVGVGLGNIALNIAVAVVLWQPSKTLIQALSNTTTSRKVP